MTLMMKRCERCGEQFQPVIYRQRFCSKECIPHGTKAGHEAHKRAGEQSCDMCRHAESIYIREWRNRNRDRQQSIEARQHARERAMRKLARQYPRKFKKLLDAELAAMETTP